MTLSKLTIYNVADAIGVSSRTVSRVLNGQPGVKSETREKVEQYIKEVGFRPHMGARSLRREMRDCIGVTLPAPIDVVPLSQAFLSWLFVELYNTFGLEGAYVSFDLNPFQPGTDQDYARGLWEQRFNGLIVAGPIGLDDEVIIRVHQSGRPYMTLGRHHLLPEISCATVDYEHAAYLSTAMLMERGHESIAMLQPFEGYSAGMERCRGYMRAHEEAGIRIDLSLVRLVTLASQHLRDDIFHVLSNHNVTGLVDCSGNEDGSVTLEAARRAGRRIGGDFEAVSWSYTYDATVLPEAIAHVWLPVREAAAEGLQHFKRWFHGETTQPVHVLYQPTVYQPGEAIGRPRAVPLFSMD